MISDPLHVYLGSLPAPGNSPVFCKLFGHNQVTDAYLLLLARKYNAAFATFDNRLRNLAADEQRIEILS
jgi:hypothetical protein